MSAMRMRVNSIARSVLSGWSVRRKPLANVQPSSGVHAAALARMCIPGAVGVGGRSTTISVMRPSAAVRRLTCQVSPFSDRYTKSERQERPGVSARRICAEILLLFGTTSVSPNATTVRKAPAMKIGVTRRWKEIPPALAATISRCSVIE